MGPWRLAAAIAVLVLAACLMVATVTGLDRSAGASDPADDGTQAIGTVTHPAGIVEDSPAFAVANTGGDQGPPDLTAGFGDQWGIAYDHPIPGGDGISLRTVASK